MFDDFNNRPSLSEKISKNILKLIKEEQLKPGDRLPPERELAKTLSVSRTSLREALRALSMMKILDIKQGDGTYITSLEPQLLVQNLQLIFDLNPKTVLDVFEFQKIFEPTVAMLAAQRASEEDIAELEELLDLAKEKKDDLKEFLDTMKLIRLKLYEITGNSVIENLSKVLYQVYGFSSIKHGETIGISEKALNELEKTIDAIKHQDPIAAFKGMEERFVELINEYLEKGDGVNIEGVKGEKDV